MLRIIFLNDMLNNLLNQLVRNLDPVLRGGIALLFFALTLFTFAKSIKTKYKSGFPFNVGWLVLALIFLAVALIYTLV